MLVCDAEHGYCSLTVSLSLAEKKAANENNHQPSKDGEELDQVAGNAEDEIGERIAAVRETELLYGPESLLAVYGPMIVHICGSPHKFKACPHLPLMNLMVINDGDRTGRYERQ